MTNTSVICHVARAFQWTRHADNRKFIKKIATGVWYKCPVRHGFINKYMHGVLVCTGFREPMCTCRNMIPVFLFVNHRLQLFGISYCTLIWWLCILDFIILTLLVIRDVAMYKTVLQIFCNWWSCACLINFLKFLLQEHGIDHLVIPTRDYLFAPSPVDICRAVDFIHSK